jgi:hypothetical protein
LASVPIFPFRKSLPLAGKVKPRNSLGTHRSPFWCEWKVFPAAGSQATGLPWGSAARGVHGRLACKPDTVLLALKQVNLRRNCAPRPTAVPDLLPETSVGSQAFRCRRVGHRGHAGWSRRSANRVRLVGRFRRHGGWHRARAQLRSGGRAWPPPGDPCRQSAQVSGDRQMQEGQSQSSARDRSGSPLRPML